MVTAAGLALGAQAGPTAQPPIAVTIDNGRLTLSAPGAKLDRLIRAIGAKAGFKVIIKGNLATPTLYTATNGAPLERAIQRLVGGNSMVMVYEPDGDGNGLRPPRRPDAYLSDVLRRMTDGHPMSRLDDLLPWNWSPMSANP